MKLIETLTEEYVQVQESVQQIICSNESIKKLQNIWSYIETGTKTFCDERDVYDFLADKIENFSIQNITAEDISSFCIQQTLRKETPEYFGFFLSAIINKHFEETKYNETYQLVTKYFKQRIAGLGFLNETKLFIQGDCRYIGSYMKNGKITIEGNCADVGERMSGGDLIVNNERPVYFAGNQMSGGNILIHHDCANIGHAMQGGTILIEGNGDDNVGFQQEGGYIIIKGFAGKFLGREKKGGTIEVHEETGSFMGHLMEDGVIHVHQEISELKQNPLRISSSIKGGEIYSKGIRVYPK